LWEFVDRLLDLFFEDVLVVQEVEVVCHLVKEEASAGVERSGACCHCGAMPEPEARAMAGVEMGMGCVGHVPSTCR
jgi:hypothetical protein